MLISSQNLYRWGLLVALAALGCRDNVYCPDSLASCPATMPTIGAPCTGTSPVGGCEYGDDPAHSCNMIFVCNQQAGWYLDTAFSQPACPTTLLSDCPGSFAEAQTVPECSSGPTDHPTCRYPEGTCDCRSGLSSFSCTPPAAAGCPTARPRSGTPCAGPCTSWGSGTCDGESMICACGVWQLRECTE